MEEQITGKLKELTKMTNSMTRKYYKSTNSSEKEKLHTELARLDGKFEAYMDILKMIKGE